VVGAIDREQLERRVLDDMDAGSWERAVVGTIDGYGPEIVRYLHTLLRDPVMVDDAFSLFCESVWRGLPRFRRESTLRVWCYALARHARSAALRAGRRGGEVLGISEIESVRIAAANVRTRTAEYLRTGARARIEQLRARLDPEDQMLLVLRITRRFEWKDIARALADVDEPLDDATLARRATALRKRYQRVKDELRAAARAQPDDDVSTRSFD
jgi:RNA polymerase sigma-70 factor (ECF subfamily)